MSRKSIICIIMAIIIIILALCSVYIIKSTNNKSKEKLSEANNSNSVSNEINNNTINNNVSGKEQENSSNKPYIPDGFTHVSGTDVETGYIIIDENDNEYVWVPVESGILTRKTARDKKYEDLDITTTGLINSVSKYHGFYIARYEASQTQYKGKTVCASIKNNIPWLNATYDEAYNACYDASKAYGYSNITTSLINSYAWDTVLDWINKTNPNYSTNTGFGNYSGTILKTGETESDEVNSICDLAGNVKEWTTEVYYPELNNQENAENIDNESEEDIAPDISYRVIRGGSANITKSPSSHIGQNSILTDSYLGFRGILYINS